MKVTYVVLQTKDFTKGGTFLAQKIGEYTDFAEAMHVAKAATAAKLCEITIRKNEHMARGSVRSMIVWQGIRA